MKKGELCNTVAQVPLINEKSAPSSPRAPQFELEDKQRR